MTLLSYLTLQRFLTCVYTQTVDERQRQPCQIGRRPLPLITRVSDALPTNVSTARSNTPAIWLISISLRSTYYDVTRSLKILHTCGHYIVLPSARFPAGTTENSKNKASSS